MKFLTPLLFALISLPWNASLAHGPVSEAIAAVSGQIQLTPDQPELYLSRARLHAEHVDWPAAHADLDTAGRLSPGRIEVRLLRGEVFAKAADFGNARAEFQKALAEKPDSGAAHAGLARVLFSLGEYGAAADSFGNAARFSAQPEPSWYINQAAALEKAGRVPDAIRALDSGIARLGPLVSLVSPAIELELSSGNTNAALARLDAFMVRQPRRELSLVRKAEILTTAGRMSEAHAAWTEAGGLLATLPETRRSTPQMIQLRAKIDEALNAAKP